MFDCPIAVGETVDNGRLCEVFRCSPQGGMRRSHETNTLVIVSDRTKGLYRDRPEGDVLHYTGMGRAGDQSLDFHQNRTLADSRENGIDVHLFEVLRRKNYIYRGRVELAANPYREQQLDEGGQPRNVWMFPVQIVQAAGRVEREEVLAEADDAEERKVRRLTDEALRERALAATGRPGRRGVTGDRIERDPYVAEYAKRRAAGLCQLCGKEAPFRRRDRSPYLEVHHVEWLSEGGPDTVENAVALCPNCHRKMHVLNVPGDVRTLRIAASMTWGDR